ncbi:MAG: DEAD/DEAH box helicase [Niastella sp.]|nr:DEAD/DEAH box helicase [Niastella sp.]
MKAAENVLKKLLNIELQTHAFKLKFINGDNIPVVEEDFLYECIAVLNELSINKNELSRKLLVAISALLWHYKHPSWDGLKNYLILFLSRGGFGPSSIMLDAEFSQESRSYSFSHSLLNEFAITLAQAGDEIVIDGRRFLLTDFQKDLWEVLDYEGVTGISAPTSAGKSFLILLKAISYLLKKPGSIVYVVPTLSLVNQVMADFRKMLSHFQLTAYTVESGYTLGEHGPNTIFVLTQEKAITSFSQTEAPFAHLRLLVIDEIQNVERVAQADDQRAKVLYDLMVEMRNSAKIDHVIVSGPRINKIDELGSDIFGTRAQKREVESSPVLNLTYAVNQKGKQYYLTLFSDLISGNLEVKITESEAIKGYGKVAYQDSYLEYLNEFIDSFGDECVLVFSPTSSTCSTIANHFSGNAPAIKNQELDSLATFIGQTVHPSYPLVETIKKGIAYHHGKLPFHVRLLVEEVIKSGKIKTVVATTTLLQGVNLPVQNIVIRNPNLFTKQKADSVKLTNYELANLRGRAGRLLKDFIGRTFILDEKSFREEDATQLDLFKGTEKELQVGYGQKYEKFKQEIKDDIAAGAGSTEKNKEYSYLTTYIRQAALKYGINTQPRLASVGIKMSDRELQNALEAMNGLTVDRKICANNRYWDPVDLDRLHRQRANFTLPTSPQEYRISYTLKAVLEQLQEVVPTYYERHFDVYNTGESDLLLQRCILAENWLKERTLSEILSNKYYNTPKRIEDTITFVEGRLSYGLPLLLKPLYDMKHPTSMFHRFIEMGAFLPVTRALIELNIPRETAIYLKNRVSWNQEMSKKDLAAQVRSLKPGLPSWYKVQLELV